jgi:hypothetical protein
MQRIWASPPPRPGQGGQRSRQEHPAPWRTIDPPARPVGVFLRAPQVGGEPPRRKRSAKTGQNEDCARSAFRTETSSGNFRRANCFWPPRPDPPRQRNPERFPLSEAGIPENRGGCLGTPAVAASSGSPEVKCRFTTFELEAVARGPYQRGSGPWARFLAGETLPREIP